MSFREYFFNSSKSVLHKVVTGDLLWGTSETRGVPEGGKKNWGSTWVPEVKISGFERKKNIELQL